MLAISFLCICIHVLSSVDDDHDGNDYDDDQINPPENIKGKRRRTRKRLTCSYDNQFSTNTLFVIVNTYIEIIGALFRFCTTNIVKNNNNIVCAYQRKRTNETEKSRNANISQVYICTQRDKRTRQNKVKELLFSRKLMLFNSKVHIEQHLDQISIHLLIRI
jgi:hypothetical protein